MGGPTQTTSNTGTSGAAANPAANPTGSSALAASQAVDRRTSSLGSLDVQGLVNDVKASSPDVQAQRDFAAAAARSIDNRADRQAFVQALQDQGVARQPGFWERQWQGAKGLGIGVYEGGASLVGGAYELGKMGVQGVAATASFGYQYASDDAYRAQTNAAVGRSVEAAGQGLDAAGGYVADRWANPDKLLQDAQTVGQATSDAAGAVADQAEQLYDNFDKARSEAVIQGTTDQLAGQIVGRTAFEVASLVVPVSKLGLAGKGAAAGADAGQALRGADLLATGERALLRAGDDPARVARMEQQARAAATADAAVAGSAAHKAERWAEYQQRGGSWSYERWSGTYENNVVRAQQAHAAVDQYHQTLGWGRREATVQTTVDGVAHARRLDIAEVATQRGIEHKTGYQSATQANLWELSRDKALVQAGWDIQWVFTDQASAPLVKALQDAGIGVQFIGK